MSIHLNIWLNYFVGFDMKITVTGVYILNIWSFNSDQNRSITFMLISVVRKHAIQHKAMKVCTTKKYKALFDTFLVRQLLTHWSYLDKCYMAADYKFIYKLIMILSLYCKHYEYCDGINFEVVYNTKPILCIRIFIHNESLIKHLFLSMFKWLLCADGTT